MVNAGSSQEVPLHGSTAGISRWDGSEIKRFLPVRFISQTTHIFTRGIPKTMVEILVETAKNFWWVGLFFACQFIWFFSNKIKKKCSGRGRIYYMLSLLEFACLFVIIVIAIIFAYNFMMVINPYRIQG